jgi:hypothetical protein
MNSGPTGSRTASASPASTYQANRLLGVVGRETEHDIIRIVEGIEGEVPMHLDLKVRFGYGKDIPWIKADEHRATLTSGPSALLFSSPVAIEPDWETARLEANFTVRARDRFPFALTFYPSQERPAHDEIDADRELERSERLWREWASRCTYQGASVTPSPARSSR